MYDYNTRALRLQQENDRSRPDYERSGAARSSYSAVPDGLGAVLAAGAAFCPAPESVRGLSVSPGIGAMLTSALGMGSAGVTPMGTGELPTLPSAMLPQPTSSRHETDKCFLHIDPPFGRS